MIEITAEIRALIDKAAVGMELAGDEYIDPDVYKRQDRNRTSLTTGSRSGKGYRVSRHTFAHRKTAVQVSPYGGRLFICRTSRCVCRLSLIHI